MEKYKSKLKSELAQAKPEGNTILTIKLPATRMD